MDEIYNNQLFFPPYIFLIPSDGHNTHIEPSNFKVTPALVNLALIEDNTFFIIAGWLIGSLPLILSYPVNSGCVATI